MTRQEMLTIACRNSLYMFTRAAFPILVPGEPFREAPHVEALCHAIEATQRGGSRRLIITLPPRALKSTIASIAFPALILGQDPSKKILVASYGQDLAAKLSRDFRALTQSEMFRGLFPAYKASSARDAALEVETTRQGARKAVSLGGPVTSFGADIIIIDDIMKAADARSPQMREQVKSYFDDTLYSRLNDKAEGTIIVIQQRLHEDDLVGYLLEKGGWTHINLPAIAEEQQSFPLSFGRSWSRNKDDILAPALATRQQLEETRRTIGDATFSAQYQQNPTPPGGNRIRWEWFPTYDKMLPRNRYRFVVQSIDTALSEEPGADYSVCMTFGLSADNEWDLLDVDRRRLSFPDLLDAVKANFRRWRADKVIVEAAGSGTSLVQTLRRDQASGMAGKIHFYKPIDSKEVRVEVQSARLRSNCVALPAKAPWLDALRKELLAFPNGKHDDQVDALTQFLEYTGTSRFRGALNRDPVTGRRRGMDFSRFQGERAPTSLLSPF